MPLPPPVAEVAWEADDIDLLDLVVVYVMLVLVLERQALGR